MVFLLVEDGHASVAKYAASSESFARAANRMMKWDPAVALQDLRKLVPDGATDAREEGGQDVADHICQGLKDMLDGKPVNFDELCALEAPVVADVRNQQPPRRRRATRPRPPRRRRGSRKLRPRPLKGPGTPPGARSSAQRPPWQRSASKRTPR